MPQRDLLLPWRSALDNAALALELRARRGPRRGAGRRRCSSASGWRASRARGPTSCRAACASASRSLRTLLAGKPVLLLDEPFGSLDSITRAEMQEWLAGTLADEPRTVAAGHPRRRGGALPLRPRARAVARARARVQGRDRRRAPGRARDARPSPRPRSRALQAARAGGAAREAAALADWAPPLAAAGAAGRRLGGASRGSGSVEDYLLPAPERGRAGARRGPRPAAARRLGDRAGGAARLRARARGWAWRSPCCFTSPRCCAAPLYPLVVASQAVPVIVIAPILVIWFGFGMAPKLIVIALICFFPIVVNTLDGLRVGRPRPGQDAADPGRLAAGRCSGVWSCRPRCRTCSRARRWRWRWR